MGQIDPVWDITSVNTLGVWRLKGTEKLRTDEFDFRNKHKEVQAIKLLKISWSKKQQIMQAASLTIKEQKNWNIEQRKLDILDIP